VRPHPPLALVVLLLACESSGGASSGEVTSAGGAGKVASIGSLRGGGGLASASSGPGAPVRAIVRQDGPPTVSGGLEAEIVQREVRARLGAIKACYERALRRDARLAGKLALRFGIALDGRVQDAIVESETFKDEEVSSCMRSLVSHWRFPPPTAIAAVSFPLDLQPKK